MFNRLAMPLYGLMLLSFVSLYGCPPPATTKPEAAAAAGQTAGKPKPAQAVAKANTPASSLEAAREGKSPAGGPLKDIYFDFDRYDLRPDARATLKANADWLKANPSVRAEIEGHCDERGTNEYNLALGAKRAQTAQDYLISLGIAKQRLSTKSYGEELPICKEHTEECWQKNRHDRLVVITARSS